MDLDTLAENVDFDDVDDNDFGEVLGEDEHKVDINRFAIEIDLTLKDEPEVNEKSFNEESPFNAEQECCLCQDSCNSLSDLKNHLRVAHNLKKSDRSVYVKLSVEEKLKKKKNFSLEGRCLSGEADDEEDIFKDDVDNSNVGLEVKDCQESVGLEVKNFQEMKEEDSAEWKTSDLLPGGWKFKGGEGNIQFLSKEGTVVSSDEVKKLFDFKLKFKPDIWKTSEFLPQGWVGRKKKDHLGKIFVKSDNGAIFHSYKKAMAFMQIHGNEEDLKKLLFYPDGIQHRLKSSLGWKTNEYLPEGWKCKPVSGGSIRLKSDDGSNFCTYKAAAAYFKESNNFTKEDLARLFLYPDGIVKKGNKKMKIRNTKLSHVAWKTNKYLPEGWKCKPLSGSNIKLKSDDGSTFKTYKAAAAYFKESKNFTQEDLARLYLYPDGKKGSDVAWNANEYLPEGRK